LITGAVIGNDDKAVFVCYGLPKKQAAEIIRKKNGFQFVLPSWNPHGTATCLT